MNAADAQKDTNGGSGSCKSRATAGYQKEIKYDRATRDYAMYLDGELMGFGRTYHEAEVYLDAVVFDLLARGAFRTAA